MIYFFNNNIIIIINFVFIGSPTATHAMMDAGERAGAKPWKKKGGDK